LPDLQEQFAETIREAAKNSHALRIRGSGSKDFYGLPMPDMPVLDTRGHSGMVDYEPTELVVTVRSGTPLRELEALLEQSGQMLPFEPPHFGPNATIGGTVASGLSGPRRMNAGALRDFVLGAKVLDGRGELLSFGGQVVKNVAGYDLSRAMAGSHGTLAIIMEVSLKTLPRPLAENTLRFELPQDKAIETLNRWAGRPLPISASLWWSGAGEPGGGELWLRLSGAPEAVNAAAGKLGGERVEQRQAQALWSGAREQHHVFFTRATAAALPLWRVTLPPATPPAALSSITGEVLVEWSGGLRWYATRSDPARLRDLAARLGGHATLFHADDDLRRAAGVFQPLSPALMDIHRRFKQTFDPNRVFNPGRMYAEL
jgi:glycolate oxidase FAD binding subunit